MKRIEMTTVQPVHKPELANQGLRSLVFGLWSMVYDLAFLLFGIFYLPIFLTKLQQAEDRRVLLAERLGILPKTWSAEWKGKSVIWIHAVSVGEVMAVQKFIPNLMGRFSEAVFVLTTVTPTGQKIAKKFAASLVSDRIRVCYFPFDLTFAVKRFFDRLNPKILILVETELWPNVILAAKRRAVPVGIINARLSERSAGRYRMLGFCLRFLFTQLDFVLAQSEPDGARFARCGTPPECVHAAGNLKFDNVDFAADRSSGASLRREWGFGIDDKIWIAGSTHPGEEEKLLRVFRNLKPYFQPFKLILAPRHIERVPQLKQMAEATGLRVRLASTDQGSSQDADVLILDRLGVLRHLYVMADAVFVGGSLIHHGGQNPIEPAGAGRASIHGPHTFNFQDLYSMLDGEDAAVAVRDEAGLQAALHDCFTNPEAYNSRGERARTLVKRLQGASARQAEWVGNFLSPSNQERICNVHSTQKLFSSAGRGL